MSVAGDAALVAERFRDGLPEHDARVLDGMVIVDREVALGAHVKVDHPVPGDLFQHVLEEGNANGEMRSAGAVEPDVNRDAGLARIALDGGGAGGHEGAGPYQAWAGRIA